MTAKALYRKITSECTKLIDVDSLCVDVSSTNKICKIIDSVVERTYFTITVTRWNNKISTCLIHIRIDNEEDLETLKNKIKKLNLI